METALFEGGGVWGGLHVINVEITLIFADFLAIMNIDNNFKLVNICSNGFDDFFCRVQKYNQGSELNQGRRPLRFWW